MKVFSVDYEITRFEGGRIKQRRSLEERFDDAILIKVISQRNGHQLQRVKQEIIAARDQDDVLRVLKKHKPVPAGFKIKILNISEV